MEKKTFKYKVTLETVGLKYKSEGDSVEEALNEMDLKWHQLKGKGVFYIRKGKKRSQKLFQSPELRRIFGAKLTKKLWAERLESLLK